MAGAMVFPDVLKAFSFSIARRHHGLKTRRKSLLLCNIGNAALQHWQFSIDATQSIVSPREGNKIKGYEQ
ncbi:hypothetical protein B5P45_24970 [Phyllobacterium zundukense]|uniref:Uncharacterized protein n=1 Tax=Phyllobacterium zundukense TaxID=1867719 RepID=A0A2N9VS13_9HYPH|nr:hypothetical protein B5P45_24970 [Phyllobacterium zundukense]